MSSKLSFIELHSCRNCRLIDEVIDNKIKQFKKLNEENIALHTALINLRQTVSQLSSQELGLRAALNDERELNLKLSIQHYACEQKYHQFHMNITVNKDHVKVITDDFNTSTLPTTQTDLQSFIKDLQESVQSNINAFQWENRNLIDTLNDQLNKANKHAEYLLDINKKLQNELFLLKRDNLNEHKEFRQIVNVLLQTNMKYIKDVEQDALANVAGNTGKVFKSATTFIQNQLKERDKLVTILRSQQARLEGQVEEAKKEQELELQKQKKLIEELKKQLKREQEKLLASEKRRNLDGEGFRCDIKDMRKEIEKFINFVSKIIHSSNCESRDQEIIKKIDKLNDKLNLRYPKIRV